jgi:hypothetical protein
MQKTLRTHLSVTPANAGAHPRFKPIYRLLYRLPCWYDAFRPCPSAGCQVGRVATEIIDVFSYRNHSFLESRVYWQAVVAVLVR